MADDDIDEYQTLQQVLEANNIYEPRMQIEEMRTLCIALEKAEPDAPEQKTEEVGAAAPPENDTIDIVKKLFENHKNKLQECECLPEVSVVLDEDPLIVNQGWKQQTTVENNVNQSQYRGNGRSLRNRVPRNYAHQLEQPEPRRLTRKQQKQEDEEYRKLRNFLKKRDLFKPPMDIEEMRAVRHAIEQSMQDINLKPREPEFEEWTILEPERHQEQLRNENWQPPNDLNPIFLDDYQFQSALSPPNLPVAPKSPELEYPPAWSQPSERSKSDVTTLSVPPNVDSDSETEYSPDNPGPCCKVIHVVNVEVHPEPRDDREDGDADGSMLKSCKRLMTSMMSPSVPTDAWDAIDEFF
uniref:(northern house mosquito) hypothetical protein n=1 Tax=Culex pipiens TaxID=7175 RepID=A0A8D8ETA3_CULPI